MDEKKYSTITITFTNGESAVLDKDEWDEYGVKDGVFIVSKDGRWVGFYNMNSVVSVVVR